MANSINTLINTKTQEIASAPKAVISINDLPTKLAESIQNYISIKENATTVHFVQKSWQHLLRNDGCLDLRGMKITDDDLVRIIEYYKSRGKIVSIKLNCYSEITDKGLESLSSLPLQKLDLSGCSNITDKGLKSLSSLPLQQLNLRDCSNITDKGLESLSSLPLQKLNLRGCSKITGKGLESLSSLPLQKLNLSGCSKITDKGLESLSSLPLQKLNLGGCWEITDEGLKSLSSLPLQKLGLNGCSSITDKGLESLSSLPLQELSLYGCDKIKYPDEMSEVLPVSNYVRRSDFLKYGELARQADDYSDLYKLVLQYI